jgi:hypothetical protein
VMQRHRLLIDGRLKRVVVVGKRWDLVGHSLVLSPGFLQSSDTILLA